MLVWPFALLLQRPVTSGTGITRTVTLPAGVHVVASPDIDHPAITIRGSNLTVDFSGVTLQGGRSDTEPNRFTGVADPRRRRGERDHPQPHRARLQDWRARAAVDAASITGADLSYNWKPRLYSLVEHESLVDWLSYHHNEKDEWLDAGAGIYLADSDAAEIDHTTIVQGQNGLMLARSNNAKIWNNTFSFLSGVGIGLYRASGNTIMHNRVDWTSAATAMASTAAARIRRLLVYEQSSRNVIALNSVTHGGDGLFLWAGQSTMDTGQGGANDNVFFGNDFSYAAANGIEATFSRNTFCATAIEDCGHGSWGGYSFDSRIADNQFARNTEASRSSTGRTTGSPSNTFDGRPNGHSPVDELPRRIRTGNIRKARHAKP